MWGNLDRCPTLAEDRNIGGGAITRSGTSSSPAGQRDYGHVLGDAAIAENTPMPASTSWCRRLSAAGLGARLLEYAEASRSRVPGPRWRLLRVARREGGAAGVRLVPAKSGAGGLPADDPASPLPPPAAMNWNRWSGPAAWRFPSRRPPKELESAALLRADGYAVVAWADRCPDGS